MEIIGIRGRETLLLEASRDEIAKLIGYYYATQDDCPKLEPGMQIAVSDMYHQLYHLARAQKEIETASKTLHSVANLVLIMNPLVEKVIKGE